MKNGVSARLGNNDPNSLDDAERHSAATGGNPRLRVQLGQSPLVAKIDPRPGNSGGNGNRGSPGSGRDEEFRRVRDELAAVEKEGRWMGKSVGAS
jgi:hypothetical protein